MPTFKQQHVSDSRLPYNSQTDAAGLRHYLVGAAVLFYELGDSQVHVRAPATLLREWLDDWKDRKQHRTAVRLGIAGFSSKRGAAIRATDPFATILDSNRYFNPTMPLPESVCHGLCEVLDRFGERIPTFKRAEDLCHLLLG
jgi:hypothetical protein